MSLLDHYKKQYYLMDEVRTADGAGGFVTVWTEGVELSLIERHDTTIEAQKAEKAGTASTYTFLFDKALSFKYHDVLKRKEDGQCFRITQPSGEQYTPSMSNLNLGSATAEKWELKS